MKDLLRLVQESRENLRKHDTGTRSTRKVGLTPVQKRILELLAMYGEPAERDELLQPDQDRQVLSRMVKNTLIRFDAYHRMYELTSTGELALKDGFYYPALKL